MGLFSGSWGKSVFQPQIGYVWVILIRIVMTNEWLFLYFEIFYEEKNLTSLSADMISMKFYENY